ncbi:MAG: hypothetical protein WCG94_01805, partial [Methanothrix sp.]
MEVKIVFLWFDHHDQAYEKAYYVLENTALNYPDFLANDGYPERYNKERPFHKVASPLTVFSPTFIACLALRAPELPARFFARAAPKRRDCESKGVTIG